eukprot:6481597-Amphidinium_carterae.1
MSQRLQAGGFVERLAQPVLRAKLVEQASRVLLQRDACLGGVQAWNCGFDETASSAFSHRGVYPASDVVAVRQAIAHVEGFYWAFSGIWCSTDERVQCSCPLRQASTRNSCDLGPAKEELFRQAVLGGICCYTVEAKGGESTTDVGKRML